MMNVRVCHTKRTVIGITLTLCKSVHINYAIFYFFLRYKCAGMEFLPLYETQFTALNNKQLRPEMYRVTFLPKYRCVSIKVQYRTPIMW